MRTFTILLGLCLSAIASAEAKSADIFRSMGADGTVRYASQALDASYTMLIRDDQSRQAPIAAAAKRASGSVATGHQKPQGTSSGPLSQSRQVAAALLEPIIERMSRKHAVDAALVRAVIGVESNANPAAVSPKGAAGAMQLMPATAAMYGVTERSDPVQNIEAGVRHLKYLLALHNGNLPLTLAAYNAGEGAVAKYAGRIPPYRETMLYVPAVLARMHALRSSPLP